MWTPCRRDRIVQFFANWILSFATKEYRIVVHELIARGIQDVDRDHLRMMKEQEAADSDGPIL